MEPNTSPQPTPETTPAPQPVEAPQAPESMPSAPADPAPAVPVSALPVVAPVAADPATTPAPPVTDTPAIADDVDVIEKEWVDKAQEVIKQTKDDPYQEEEQIEDLQRDYLKKRYGKEVGDSSSGS